PVNAGFFSSAERINTPLFPPESMAYSSSRAKSPYSLSVRSQEPLFSGLVLQSFPFRPTSTPSSTVHSPPYITTHPLRSLPLKIGFPSVFRQSKPGNDRTN